MVYISRKSVIVYIVYILCSIHYVTCKQCVTDNSCRCTFDDGSGVVDISSLESTGQARFKQSAPDLYTYAYNPCTAFTEGTGCIGVSACQISADGLTQYPLGDQTTAEFSYDGTNIQLYYNKHSDFDDVTRETFVTYVCDPNAKSAAFTPEGERIPGSAQYYMTVTTECACANGCASVDPIITVTIGISTGTVLCILFLVFGFLYVVSGMAFMRTRRQAVGVEMLPNRGFWTALPGLIKDGFVFCVTGIKGLGGKKSNYDQI